MADDLNATAKPNTGSTFYLGWQLFVRDFHSRYRRTGLAVLWILSPMLAITAISSLVAQSIDGAIGSSGIPYPVFAATGLVLWGLFAEALTGPQQMCRRTRSILKRVPFPPAALLVANTCYLLMNFTIKLVPLAGIFAYHGIAPASTAWLALPALLGLMALGSVIGMLLVPVSMVYQDVRHGLSMVMGVLLLATPVLYHVPVDGARHLATALNPIAWLLTPARDYILHGHHEGLFTGSNAVAVVVPLLLLLPAYAYYRSALKIGIAHL